jgi:hypothetical protein
MSVDSHFHLSATTTVITQASLVTSAPIDTLTSHATSVTTMSVATATELTMTSSTTSPELTTLGAHSSVAVVAVYVVIIIGAIALLSCVVAIGLLAMLLRVKKVKRESLRNDSYQSDTISGAASGQVASDVYAVGEIGVGADHLPRTSKYGRYVSRLVRLSHLTLHAALRAL